MSDFTDFDDDALREQAQVFRSSADELAAELVRRAKARALDPGWKRFEFQMQYRGTVGVGLQRDRHAFRKTYSFIALRLDTGQIYLTGGSQNFPSWDQFVAWLKREACWIGPIRRLKADLDTPRLEIR